MIARVYNTDDPSDIRELQERMFKDAHGKIVAGCEERPSNLIYGTDGAIEHGLIPFEDDDDAMDILLPSNRLEAAITEAQQREATPSFWDYVWCPKGVRYTQGRLNYCWGFAATGALRTRRVQQACEDISLAAVSLGFDVGWRNAGNTLPSTVRALINRGVCPGDMNDHRNTASVWEPLEDKRIRLAKAWDLNPRDMLRQMTSALYYGFPILGAWAWWGHAVQLVDVYFVNGRPRTELNNTHNEDEHIFLDGSQALPSEGVIFAAAA